MSAKQYLIKAVVTTDDFNVAMTLQNWIAKLLVKEGDHFNVFDPIELNTARIEQVRAYAKEHLCNDEVNVDDDAVLSEGEDGPWIQAWLFIPKNELDLDETDLSADQLDDKYNQDGDGEHPTYPKGTWVIAVGTWQTLMGYWDWVAYQIELKDNED
jgi:hypothetical protein